MPPQAEQLDLIDVDDPKFKAVKKQIKEYEALKEENREQASANRTAEQNKRKKVLEAVNAAGIKPDQDGAYHVQVDGKIYDISQESQLRIKKHNAPSEDAGGDDEPDDETKAEGAEQESRRGEPGLRPRKK